MSNRIEKLETIFKYSEILMRELEEERNESLENLRFEGEEEILIQYYKKILMSIYRMRNNAAALLLKHKFGCVETNDQICMDICGVKCEVSRQALKNILQKEFDSIIAANQNTNHSKKEHSDVGEDEKHLDILNIAEPKLVEEDTISGDKTDALGNDKIKEENVTEQIPKAGGIKKSEHPSLTEPDFFDMDFFGDMDRETEPILEKADEKRELNRRLEEPAVMQLEKAEETFIPDNLDIPMKDDTFDDFSFFDEEFESKAPDVKEEKNAPFKQTPEIGQSSGPLDSFDIDFAFFDEEPKQNEKKDGRPPRKEEKKEAGHKSLGEVKISGKNPFRETISFILERKEVETKKEDVKPKFVTEVSTDDPDEIIKRLRKSREEYDKKIIEQKILDEQKEDMFSGTVFDLSTGSSSTGQIDAKEAAEKIEKVADSLVEVSRKDKLLDIQVDAGLNPGQYTYCVQRETDYERAAEKFIFDMYKLNIRILDDNGIQIKEDQVKLIVAPIDIPESGTKLVTDVCAYLENDGERHGAVVLPGGKTTITVRCEDYAVFVRGSWDKGKFASNISVVGSGNKAEFKMDKREIRPSNMENIGIGHNLLILDHATTVHIIPIGFKNTDYGYAEFMGVIIKDYGVDKDAECQMVKEDGTIQVKGERYKFNVSALWEDKKFILDSRIER